MNRGGSWGINEDVRSAGRNGYHDPDVRRCDLGFRLARSVRTAISFETDPAAGTVSQESVSRFEVDGSIITDTATGLEWQVGPDSDTDWDEAHSWANSLGGSWSTPSIAQLRGLYNAGVTSSNWGYFQNCGTAVWSFADEGYLCAWDFQSGCYVEYEWTVNPSFNFRGFAVRPL